MKLYYISLYLPFFYIFYKEPYRYIDHQREGFIFLIGHLINFIMNINSRFISYIKKINK